MFATVVAPSPGLLVRGGLHSVAAGRVLVRGEHSRDVHDVAGPSEAQGERPLRRLHQRQVQRGRYALQSLAPGEGEIKIFAEGKGQEAVRRGGRDARPAGARRPARRRVQRGPRGGRVAINPARAGHYGPGQTRRCVRVILRAARSSRALATDLLSLLAAGAGLAFEFNFDDEGEDGPPAPTGGRCPGALAAARVQGEAQRIFPACVRDGQSSKTIPWEPRDADGNPAPRQPD